MVRTLELDVLVILVVLIQFLTVSIGMCDRYTLVDISMYQKDRNVHLLDLVNRINRALPV